jgi:hypothetical protein
LLRSLAGTVNNLRKTSADLTMMVYVSKTQILKRQMTKLFNRIADTYVAALYALQQFF